MIKSNGSVLFAGTVIFGLGTLVGYSIPHNGSSDPQKDETVLSEAQKEKICGQHLEPLQARFERECNLKTIDNLYNGTLGAIIERRDEVSAENDCKYESWVCEPQHPGNYRTTFKARFGQ